MRRFAFLFRAMPLLAVAAVASASTFNIALLSALGNNSLDNDVVAKIQADAPFLNISIIKVDAVTPTVATIEGYQAVLLMSNNPFADGVTLGNNLKQYIDDGHGVVVANNSSTTTNCSFSSLYQLCGAFNSADYWAIEPGSPKSTAHLTLGTVYVADSPLMAGVTSFDGGTISNRLGGSVNASATRIADWSDGTPLVASRTFAGAGREVALNFYPPSSDGWPGLWASNTDGGKLLGNALLFAGDINGSDVPEPNYLVAGAGLAVVSLLMRRRRR